MMTKGLGPKRGFTLMEMLFTIAIMGIILAVAYPSYLSMLTKNRRLDAQGALQSFVIAMERYRTDNNNYTSAAVGTVFPAQSPVDSEDKYYNLSISAQTASSYTLRATPINGTSQEGDGFMEITSTGLKRWDKNNNGSIGSGETDWDD